MTTSTSTFNEIKLLFHATVTERKQKNAAVFF